MKKNRKTNLSRLFVPVVSLAVRGARPPRPFVHLATALLLGLAGAGIAAAAGEMAATAPIQGCEDKAIQGRITLTETPSSEGVKEVQVEIEISGMKPGKHAVHIHETGACEPCAAAKGHFDPGPASNPSPDGNHPFHMGDLVNIDVGPDGRGRLQVRTTRVTLSPGPLSLLDADGSAVIIHVDPDTYCPEGEAKNCAGGARAACGVIAMPKAATAQPASAQPTATPPATQPAEKK